MINVTFISKILERIVAFQLIAYFDANDLLPSCQSGFPKNHSTETLLIRLLSDLYDAIDVGHISLLALFDVSSLMIVLTIIYFSSAFLFLLVLLVVL